MEEFRNEPFTDFAIWENAEAMRTALRHVGQELGREYPLVIGGERITTPGKIDSLNPSKRAQLVGRFQKATSALAEKAVETANKAFSLWRQTPPADRASLLLRVAAILRKRKHEMSAWMVYEVGKTWSEAD